MNPQDAQITIIGAGSVEFTRIILADLAEFPELRELRIVLHDIDAERLDTAAHIARRVNEATGARFAVTTHAERRAALEGADFVVNEIQVGGLQATRRDFEIPARYGVRQTIGDTLGIGGIFRALRTIPVLLAIARDMAEVCPDAVLLNYTNPMAMLMWALSESGHPGRAVGLCHSVQNTHEYLARLTGQPVEALDFLTAGVNHQAFVLRFERDGRSLYPDLDRVIEDDPDGVGRTVRVELYRCFGHFPTESSEHGAEYVPWFMRHDSELERLRIPVDEYIRRSLENLDEYADTRRRIDAGEPIPISGEGELAPRYIHSLLTGTRRVEYGNVRNDGLITNLPEGACVEVPCVLDANGISPMRVGALPHQCAALNRTFLGVVELTVRAALEGSRTLVHQAALLDPNTAATLTTGQTKALVEELIAAHGELLPEGIRDAALTRR